jgi:hypothetical protein
LQKLEAAKNAPKEAAPEDNVEYWIGIDLGDRRNLDSLVLNYFKIFEKYFGSFPKFVIRHAERR